MPLYNDPRVGAAMEIDGAIEGATMRVIEAEQKKKGRRLTPEEMEALRPKIKAAQEKAKKEALANAK